MTLIRVAIDGPAGAGKSTTAKLLARRLRYIYVDTGAMYRTLTLSAIEENLDPKNETVLSKRLHELNIRLTSDGKTYIGERDVTEDIRLPAVDALVSIVCAHPMVRREMVRRQREMAEAGGVVMEGRDIGTVVIPDAELKLFITARPDIRAERRSRQLIAGGIEVDLEKLEQEIIKRDELDSTRENSPLKQAEAAILIDTSDMPLMEVVDKVEKLAREKGA